MTPLQLYDSKMRSADYDGALAIAKQELAGVEPGRVSPQWEGRRRLAEQSKRRQCPHDLKSADRLTLLISAIRGHLYGLEQHELTLSQALRAIDAQCVKFDPQMLGPAMTQKRLAWEGSEVDRFLFD